MRAVGAHFLTCALLLLPIEGLAEERADAEGPPPPADAGEPEGGAEPEAEPVAALVAALAEREPARRIEAVRALGAEGSEEAAAALMEVLGSEPSPEVRAWAARALAETGSAAGRERLARLAATDPDERVRALAARLSGLGLPPPVGAVETAAAAAAAVPPVMDQEEPVEPESPVPPSRTPRRLLIAGWTTFGVSYFACFLAGIVMMSLADPAYFWPLVIPGVGPGILAGQLAAEGGVSLMTPTALAAVAAAVQVTGIVLLALGHHGLRRARAAVAVAPLGPGGSAGLGLVAWY